MSAFTKAQMQFTRGSVNVVRKAVDTVNTGIALVAGPLSAFIRKHGKDSTWLVIGAVSVASMSCPLFLFPYFKDWIIVDKRKIREEERVRLCLEKGIDPFPHLGHKTYIVGSRSPGGRTEEETPKDVSPEYAAVQRYEEAKQRIIAEAGGGDVEKSVMELKQARKAKFNEFRKQISTGGLSEEHDKFILVDRLKKMRAVNPQ